DKNGIPYIPVRSELVAGKTGRPSTTKRPTIVIGIPVRYEHSPYCFSSYKDYKAAVDLALAIIRDIDKEKLESFKSFN
ncbi:peptidase M42, partial [Lactobacillus delbrueckii subsp. bulgaricus]